MSGPPEQPNNRRLRRLRRDTVRVLAASDHGTRNSYARGCRCDACTDAESDASAARKRARRQGGR